MIRSVCFNIFMSFCIVNTAFAQSINFVSNGSFEDFISCPEGYETNSYIQRAVGWNSPTKGTPDYFNACSEHSGVPLNWVGNAEAFNGVAYMGIIACMYQMDPNQIAYREYLSTQLVQPLEQGKTYYASMYVRHGLSCNTACNGLGMYFSNREFTLTHNVNLPFVPQIKLQENPIIDEVNDWTKICGTFIAKGGEQHVVIGNFLSNQAMEYYIIDENFIPTLHVSPMAYYYIDNVEVYLVDSLLSYNCENLEEKNLIAFEGHLPYQGKLILSNLYFEIDESMILPESFDELDQLAHALMQKPGIRISINGHTDNSGNEEHNKNLSLERANAVKRYLLAKGVSRFSLITEGFGSTQPLEDNGTEVGRQKNRRVEINVLN